MVATEIVIDCPHCVVRIKVAATSWVSGTEPDEGLFLLKCPTCGSALLGRSISVQDEWNNWCWTPAERLWPVPSLGELSVSVPEGARRDIRDAHKCLTSGIYSACAVLCGRALERLIKEKVGPNMIGKGLSELKKQGLIDEKLSQWAEALRKERNIGAHASDEDTTKENAQDILDFTIAIFDYVYTLTDKYERYQKRRAGNGES